MYLQKEISEKLKKYILKVTDRHWWRLTGTGGAITGTGGAVCKGATPSVEQPGGRGFKPRLQSLLD
jgi:hypothetical protein